MENCKYLKTTEYDLNWCKCSGLAEVDLLDICFNNGINPDCKYKKED